MKYSFHIIHKVIERHSIKQLLDQNLKKRPLNIIRGYVNKEQSISILVWQENLILSHVYYKDAYQFAQAHSQISIFLISSPKSFYMQNLNILAYLCSLTGSCDYREKVHIHHRAPSSVMFSIFIKSVTSHIN